jgi:hypothetical protein
MNSILKDYFQFNRDRPPVAPLPSSDGTRDLPGVPSVGAVRSGNSTFREQRKVRMEPLKVQIAAMKQRDSQDHPFLELERDAKEPAYKPGTSQIAGYAARAEGTPRVKMPFSHFIHPAIINKNRQTLTRDRFSPRTSRT